MQPKLFAKQISLLAQKLLDEIIPNNREHPLTGACTDQGSDTFCSTVKMQLVKMVEFIPFNRL